MEITYRELSPDKVVIVITGKIMLGPESERISDLVASLMREGKRSVIFDISGVTAIDSTGLGRFISSYREIAAVGGKMRIAGANSLLRRTFHVCRLDTIFKFDDDVEQAIVSSGD